MYDRINTELERLLTEMNRFTSFRNGFEQAREEYFASKKNVEQLEQSLEELIEDKADNLINKNLHKKVTELTQSYENILKKIFENQLFDIVQTIDGISGLIKSMAVQIDSLNDVKAKHTEAIESMNVDYKNHLKSLEQIYKDGFSEYIEQIKSSSTQFNITSNISQSNIKKNLEEFSNKIQNINSDDSIKKALKEEVSKVTQASLGDIPKLIKVVSGLTEELKFLKAAKMKE